MDHPRHRHVPVAAVHRYRTGEHHLRSSSFTQGVEQGTGGIQVGVQPQVQVRLTFTRNRRREMENRIESFLGQIFDLVNQYASEGTNPRIVGHPCGGCSHIRQHQLAQRPARKVTALQQNTRQARSDKPGSPGNQNLDCVWVLHGGWFDPFGARLFRHHQRQGNALHPIALV